MFQATKGQHCKKKDKTKKIEGQHRYWNTLWKQTLEHRMRVST